MSTRFPAIYRDASGVESAELLTDGRQSLRIMVRGIVFAGPQFDMLDPAPGTDNSALAAFTLHRRSLSAYEVEYGMPMTVVVGDEVKGGQLQIRVEVPPLPNAPSPQWPRAYLALTINDQTYSSSGYSGHFEAELLQIQQALPDDSYMRACINCAYSDYSPAGQDMLGMMCFRRNKAAYRTVETKQDMFRVIRERHAEIETVQEMHLCPEFERRSPGSGYRG